MVLRVEIRPAAYSGSGKRREPSFSGSTRSLCGILRLAQLVDHGAAARRAEARLGLLNCRRAGGGVTVPSTVGAEMTESVHAGGCLCGAVRYQVAGAPLRVGLCHCETCRRNTGASFGTFAVIRREQFTLLFWARDPERGSA